MASIFSPVPRRSGLSTDAYIARLAKIWDTEMESHSVFGREKVGIVGAGLMGCSIAAAFLRQNLPVLIFDREESARVAAPDRIVTELATQLDQLEPLELLDRRESKVSDSGGTSPESLSEARQRVARFLTITEGLADFDSVDVILETIPEKLKLKTRFSRELDAVLTGPKLLVSNTSTIPITELAAGLEGLNHLSPTRYCGFHFFHPVRKRSLVEIIRGEQTASETLDRAESLARRLDKKPIRVEDGPGFLVNRLLNPYLDEAMTLLTEGVSPERIESVCRRFGMEMGPLRILDEIGLDVAIHSGWTFYKAFPARIGASALLPAMIDDGRLGRKNGRGFFLYETAASWDGEGKPDPLLTDVIKKIAPPTGRLECVTAEGGPLAGPEISDELLAARVFFGIELEARRAIAAGIAPTLDDADRAMVFGLGFPKNRGGIIHWAESLGPELLAEWRRRLAPLGPKFAPF